MSKNILNNIDIKSTLSIGLDVSKEKIDVCFLSQERNNFCKVKNNKESLVSFIELLKTEWLNKKIPIIIESTWDYNTLACILFSNNWLNIKEINPIITKNYVKHTIRGTKTDKTDAEALAKIWLNEKDLFTYNKDIKFIELNKKISLIATLEKQLQSLKMSLKSFKEENLRLELKESNAVKSIEISIQELEENVKALQKEVEDISMWDDDDRKVEQISSIKWVSKYMWKVFFSIFAHKEFTNKKAMYAFTGCDPKLKDSWQMIWKASISKRGDPYLRKKLFQSANMARLHSSYFKAIYEKHRESWKHYFTCLLIVAKKIVHIIYSMLKNWTYFNDWMLLA